MVFVNMFNPLRADDLASVFARTAGWQPVHDACDLLQVHTLCYDVM